MITCYLRYIIHPHEGANNIAVALFSFPSLADYEQYRINSQNDADCVAAYAFEQANQSIISYERSFMRPVFCNDFRRRKEQ